MMRYLYGLLLILLLSGCIDILTDDVKPVIGKLKLMHVNGTTVEGYSLEKEIGNSIYEPIVSETVQALIATDSVIYIKSSDKTATNYYCISHVNGDTITGITKIDAVKFSSGLNSVNKKVRFTYP